MNYRTVFCKIVNIHIILISLVNQEKYINPRPHYFSFLALLLEHVGRSSSFLSHFQRLGRLLQRNLQLSLFSSLLFSCMSSQLSPLISISFIILPIYLALGLSLSSFPPFLCVAFYLGIFSSLICITCPNHLNLLF
jgi:hypothetical protein